MECKELLFSFFTFLKLNWINQIRKGNKILELVLISLLPPISYKWVHWNATCCCKATTILGALWAMFSSWGRKWLWSDHWALLLGNKRGGATVNQRHFPFFCLCLFFLFSVKRQSGWEFCNSLIITKPFFPSATELASKTYICQLASPFAMQRSGQHHLPTFSMAAGQCCSGTACNLQYFLSSPEVASFFLICCETSVVLLLSSPFRCRKEWHHSQKWTSSLRTHEKNRVLCEIWI